MIHHKAGKLSLKPDKKTGGTIRAVGGLYEDEMVKVDGRWLYAKRVYRIVVEYQPTEA